MSSPLSAPTNRNPAPGFTTPTPTLLHTLQPQQVAWRDDFYKLMLGVCETRTAGQSEFLTVHSSHLLRLPPRARAAAVPAPLLPAQHPTARCNAPDTRLPTWLTALQPTSVL